MTGVATDDDATGGKLEADGFTVNDKKNGIISRRYKQLETYMRVFYVNPTNYISIIPLLCHFVVFWLLAPPIVRNLALNRSSFTRPSYLIGSG